MNRPQNERMWRVLEREREREREREMTRKLAQRKDLSDRWAVGGGEGGGGGVAEGGGLGKKRMDVKTINGAPVCSGLNESIRRRWTFYVDRV